MIIIGERINATNKRVREAILKKDEGFIVRLATAQREAGADYIDLNVNTGSIAQEVLDMEWAIKTIKKQTDMPLCIDTTNYEAMEVGMRLLEKEDKLLNSISLEEERLEAFLPLVKQYKPKVIGLCMSGEVSGVPKTATERIRIATELIQILLASAGLSEQQIFIDPVICSLATDYGSAVAVLEAIRQIKANYPQVHITCGLSNISHGLPQRSLLNCAFLVLLLQAGLNSAILDPLDKRIMSFVAAGKVLLGKDEFCLNYIRAYRTGKLNF